MYKSLCLFGLSFSDRFIPNRQEFLYMENSGSLTKYLGEGASTRSTSFDGYAEWRKIRYDIEKSSEEMEQAATELHGEDVGEMGPLGPQ